MHQHPWQAVSTLRYIRHTGKQFVYIQLREPAVPLGILVTQREPQVFPVGIQVQPHGIDHIVQGVEAPRALIQIPPLIYQRIPTQHDS